MERIGHDAVIAPGMERLVRGAQRDLEASGPAATDIHSGEAGTPAATFRRDHGIGGQQVSVLV